MQTIALILVIFFVWSYQTKCHLKHPQRLEDVDSLHRVGVKALIYELTAANQRLSSSEFSVSSYILVLRYIMVYGTVCPFYMETFQFSGAWSHVLAKIVAGPQ